MQRVIARCMQRLRPEGNVFLLDDTVVCHVPTASAASRQRTDLLCRSVASETTPILDGPAIVVESQVCQTLEDYAAAWEQCRRITAVARRFQRRGHLTAQDFGPYLMLLGAADAAEVRLFVEHSVGALLRHDAEHGTPYVSTLANFLHSGCRHQICADVMQLHVTTLRYRLARIQQLFDVQFETAEERFALQLALHLQAIIGEAPPRRKGRTKANGRAKSAAARRGLPRSRRKAMPTATAAIPPVSD
jgi:sugar diacid utilization regulator